MKRPVLIILVILCCANYGHAKNGMHPEEQIDYVKEQIKKNEEPYVKAYEQLLLYADSVLTQHHQALTDFAVPGFYDKPAQHRANSLALQKDAFGAYCTALAYRLSGKKKYGEKAVYFLNAWAAINKRYSEHDGVLVMAYSGSAMLMAATLMENQKIWKKEDKGNFKKWVIAVYQDACNQIRGHKNNWADWGRFGSLLAASFLEDKMEIQENIRLIKSDLFIKIAADGSMPEETRRGNNGIWYTYFSLAPMTASCWVVYNLTGENLFALEEKGVSIKKALDYLCYYNEHPEEWKWDKNPNVGSPKLWPGNLFEAMSGIYQDKNYEANIAGNRPLIYPVHHFAWVFPTLMPLYSNRYPSSE